MSPVPLLGRIYVALCGLLVLGSLACISPRAQSSTEVTVQSVPDTTQRDTSGQSAEDDEPNVMLEADVSEGETVLETFLEIFLLGPIFLLFMALLLSVPLVLLGVAVVIDGRFLQYTVFSIGWVCAIFYGMCAGMMIGEGLFGTESLVMPIIHIFTWGYPILALWVDVKLEKMPEEQYRAWDQTLTGGALLGFGAGSIASLFRSAASGFGGFGGGSFGGGGASGSWSGASGAASASAGAGSAGSAAAGASTGTAGGTSGAAAATAGAAAESSSSPPDRSEKNRDERSSIDQWFDKFQWYHGIVFTLAIIVFMPFGLSVFWTVLVGLLVYSAYKLLRRYPEATRGVVRSPSSFGDGEASAGAGSVGSAAAGASTGTAGGTSGAAGATAGAAAESSSSPPDRSEPGRGGRGSIDQWFDKFQWYHGIVFTLAIIVFMPFGLSAMQALQNPEVFWTVLVGLLVYSVYKLLRRSPEATRRVVRSLSSFGGGEASSSW